MNETRRFLRYVTPGSAFLVEVLFLCWILVPWFVERNLAELKEDAGIGLALLTIVGSGGLGFLLGAIHHELHWRPNGAIDHRAFIQRLRDRQVLHLVDANTGSPVPAKVRPNRLEAWCITTAIWHERMSDPKLAGGEMRASSLIDLTHSMGSVRVGSCFAVLVALLIAARASQPSGATEPVVRFIVALFIGSLLVWLFHRAYGHTSRSTQQVIEEVLHDVLAQPEGKASTYVVLEDAECNGSVTSGQ